MKLKDLTLEQAEKMRQLCRTDLFFLAKDILGKNFTEFTHKSVCDFFVKKDPNFHTFREFSDAYQGPKDRLLLLPRKGYKALGLDTQVPTISGMKTIEDIKVGDVVFGIDGRQCNVIGKSEVFRNRPCYEIEFSTGERVIADEDHFWEALAHSETPGHGNSAEYKIRTTLELANAVTHGKRGDYNWRVRVAKEVFTDNYELPMAPYVFGAWLGDGNSAGGRITVGDEEVVRHIGRTEEVRVQQESDNFSCYAIGQKSVAGILPRNKTFQARLRFLSVLNNKHIPEIYFLSSVDQRMELLRGLMDTDGHCTTRGTSIFINTNHRLAKDVKRLACSLGFKATIREYMAKLNGEQMGKMWHVAFDAYQDNPVFHVKRKKLRQRRRPLNSTGKQTTRSIHSIRKVETIPVQCISVDSSDNIFLITDGYIPTHNSTAKVIDNVQWHLCWPDISIITMTAAKSLASSFVEEFQNYMVVKGSHRGKGGVLLGGHRNLFQELFINFCITEKEATSDGIFISPARSKFTKEPTIGAFSIGMSGSGWSCDIVDFDDVLSDDNTETGAQLEKLEKRIAMATNLRKKYGFRHIVGTRYDPMDAYAHIAEANGIMDLYGEYETPQFKYMCKPCWWLKGRPYQQPDYKTWKPDPEDVDLFFPEDLTFQVLSKELREQPDTFYSQSLNDPIEAANVVFTEEFIRSCFVDHTQLPKQGVVYTAWDLAYGTNKGRDYSVGATGLLDHEGRWWITHLCRGRFNYAELPFQIVNGIRTHQPRQISVEDSMGAKWLTNDLDRIAKELGVILNINWVCLGQGTDDAKYQRMSTVYSPMASRRMFILNTIEFADDLVKEFKSIGNKRQRNDIPDAISRLSTTYSSTAQKLSLPTPAEDARIWKEMEDREFHDMIYQQGKYYPRAPEPEPMKEEDAWQIDPYTGLPA